MLYANSTTALHIAASPNAAASCPLCHGAVRAKCGRINRWHWAHRSLEDCDAWAEPESDWHYTWKQILDPKHQEVIVARANARHRADLVAPGGLVVELQRSPIAPAQIAQREGFYGKMIWLFDIRDCRHNGYALFNEQPIEVHRFHLRPHAHYHTFRWKHPRKHIAFTRKPAYLDIGDDSVFHLRRISQQTPCGGWGRIIPRARFIEQIRQGRIPT
jgi:competence CoiA-like predicted nuclease